MLCNKSQLCKIFIDQEHKVMDIIKNLLKWDDDNLLQYVTGTPVFV